ncbi:hypothetical protein [Actinoallomurus acanthiterrae]
MANPALIRRSSNMADATVGPAGREAEQADPAEVEQAVQPLGELAVLGVGVATTVQHRELV